MSLCVDDNSKYNGLIHVKLQRVVGYENSLDEFDIGHCPIKVEVTARFFHHLPQYKLSGPISQLWDMFGSCD